MNKFRGVMLLGAVGDAMGYKNGDWQFNTSGKLIHSQMLQLSNGKGPLALNINMQWRYSDDTVMHMATASAISSLPLSAPIEEIGKSLAQAYIQCWSRMSGRAPGNTCGRAIKMLGGKSQNWNKIPFADNAGGCGASMRTACIGLLYPTDCAKLVAVSVQASRITHHNPTGYIGGVVAAYFTSLALRGVPPHLWAAWLFHECLPLTRAYILSSGREVQLNLETHHWMKNIDAWKSYCQSRNISIVLGEDKLPQFPEVYGVREREQFYRTLSWSGWPGALGIDSVLIAYDAILGANQSWEELCLRAVLHGGDNDSTGAIAGSWFGALYGLKGIPQNHIKDIQDHNQLHNLAVALYNTVAKNK